VAKMPVPIMLDTTSAVALKRPNRRRRPGAVVEGRGSRMSDFSPETVAFDAPEMEFATNGA